MPRTKPVTHVTRYRNVALTKHHRAQPWENQPTGYGYTKRSRRIFDHIGDCIASGGRVDMETWYDGQQERADIRLEWGNNGSH